MTATAIVSLIISCSCTVVTAICRQRDRPVLFLATRQSSIYRFKNDHLLHHEDVLYEKGPAGP